MSLTNVQVIKNDPLAQQYKTIGTLAIQFKFAVVLIFRYFIEVNVNLFRNNGVIA